MTDQQTEIYLILNEHEKRIAALEAIAKYPVYVVPPLADKDREGLRSASGGRPIPAQPMNTDPAAWAQWAAKSGAQPVEATPPATDDADEAGVEALMRLITGIVIPENAEPAMIAHMNATSLRVTKAILAAIRDGKVPGVWYNQQIATEKNALIIDNIKLRAGLVQARRERDEARGQVAHQDALVSEFSARANAALARAEKAERERDALNETGLRQKPFLYALADITGQPHLDDFCVAEHPSHLAEGAEDRELNILPLYTGPQVIKMAEQRDEARAAAERSRLAYEHAHAGREQARAEAEKLAGLLREAREWVGISTIFKHDNASIAEVCDRIDAALAGLEKP